MDKPLCPFIDKPCRGPGCVMFALAGAYDAPCGSCRLTSHEARDSGRFITPYMIENPNDENT